MLLVLRQKMFLHIAGFFEGLAAMVAKETALFSHCESVFPPESVLLAIVALNVAIEKPVATKVLMTVVALQEPAPDGWDQLEYVLASLEGSFSSCSSPHGDSKLVVFQELNSRSLKLAMIHV